MNFFAMKFGSPPAGQFPLRACRIGLALLCAAVSWLVVSSPIAHADSIAPPSALTIPFDNQAGHGDILLHIRVNDKLTGNFLLDTGAEVSVIEGDFVKKLGLRVTPTVRRRPLYMSDREIDDVTLSHVLIGDMSLRDIDIFVEPGTGGLKNGSESVCAKEEAQERKEHPERFLGTPPLDQTVDGVIGMDLWNQFALLIDFEKSEIRAWPHGNLHAADLQDVGMSQATVVPMSQEYNAGNHCYVSAEFSNGTKRGTEKMVLDTGAEQTLIAPHLADTIQIPVTHQGYSQTFYGCLPFSDGMVDTIGLNGLVLPKIGVSFTRKAPEDFPLLLGYNVFARCRVLFDFPANKLYLQAIPNIEKEDKPEAQYSDAITYQPGPNGEIFLPVQFSGDQTGTAVIDTGANRTVLSPETAERLNMSLTPLLDANGVPVQYEGAPMQMGKLPLMRFGGTGVAGFPCLVSQAPLKIAGKPVDALLGNDFLTGFLPYIDFPKHQVTFLQCRDLTGGDFEKLDMDGAGTIPITKPAAYLCGANVQLTGRSTLDETFLVSTVDKTTLISSRVATALKSKSSGVASRFETTFGPVSAAPAALDEFSMAGIGAPDDMKYYAQTEGNPLPLSILGLDVLSHYRVLLHYAEGRLYIANPSKAKPAKDITPPVVPPVAPPIAPAKTSAAAVALAQG